MLDTERSKQMWPSIKLLSNNVFTSDVACSRFYHPSKKEAVKEVAKQFEQRTSL